VTENDKGLPAWIDEVGRQSLCPTAPWPALRVRQRQLLSVIEMKRSGLVSSLGSKFDTFLLAPIGDDTNGMQLSVLSALARMDVDPWEQAATLARLPRDTATRKLASLIAALPAGPLAHLDAATIAARLIPLLPGRVGSDVPSRLTLPGVGTVTRSPVLTYLILYAIFMLFMLGFKWLGAGPQVPAPLNSAAALPARIVSPPSPPPSTGE
jgi:hypothetical protein